MAFITFLPYSDFVDTAECLDFKRLGKMRVESAQILRTLGIEGVLLTPPKPKEKISNRTNHPAVRMWVNNIECLKFYYNTICEEWIRRGYKQNMKLFEISKFDYPSWIGNERFHSSHRASLLYKNYEWYSNFGWKETPIISYIWPV
jgi:hypothetical protein